MVGSGPTELAVGRYPAIAILEPVVEATAAPLQRRSDEGGPSNTVDSPDEGAQPALFLSRVRAPSSRDA